MGLHKFLDAFRFADETNWSVILGSITATSNDGIYVRS